jgi:hypothetical protein
LNRVSRTFVASSGILAFSLIGVLSTAGAGETPEDIRLPVRVVDRDCQPFPGVRVVLVPAGAPADKAVASNVTDSNGNALLVRLPAGRYDAIASSEDFVDARVGPFVLPSKGEFRVTLAMNISLERVVRMGAIRGTAVDENGSALPGVTVTLEPEPKKPTRFQATSTDGSYAFSSVPPGRYQLVASLAGFSTPEATPIDVQSGVAITVPQIVLTLEFRDVTVTLDQNSQPLVDLSALRAPTPEPADPAIAEPSAGPQAAVPVRVEVPVCPLAMQRARMEGRVELDVAIDGHGRVAGLEVVKRLNPLSERAVMDAVSRWIFTGPGSFLVTVEFRLWNAGPEECLPGPTVVSPGLIVVYGYLHMIDVRASADECKPNEVSLDANVRSVATPDVWPGAAMRAGSGSPPPPATAPDSLRVTTVLPA